MTRDEERHHRREMTRAKEELAQAALQGILAYLSTIRGAQLMGAQARAHTCADSPRTVQVMGRVAGIPVDLEFTVRELHGSTR